MWVIFGLIVLACAASYLAWRSQKCADEWYGVDYPKEWLYTGQVKTYSTLAGIFLAGACIVTISRFLR